MEQFTLIHQYGPPPVDLMAVPYQQSFTIQLFGSHLLVSGTLFPVSFSNRI